VVVATSDDLALAHRLADLASEIALGHFARGVETIVKPDGTPVSEADLEVDRELAALLHRERPDDAVLSEESGASGSGSSGRRWILDPIDGTFNFVIGAPAWGTHVALEEDGEIVLGLITRPTYLRRWWATRGEGAWRASVGAAGLGPAERLRVSTVGDLTAARVTVWSDQPDWVFDRLEQSCALVEGTLDSVLGVIGGELEAVVAAGGVIWDQAPALVMIEEAGGTFRDCDGGRRPDHNPCHYANGRIDLALSELLAR
jgi:histidinol-phosphatase